MARGHYLPLLFVVTPLLLTGCAVGPNFSRPQAPTAARYTADPLTEPADQKIEMGANLPPDWWRLFNSPELNAIMAEALKANPDIKAADAALRAAEENLRAQDGVFLPNVQAGFDASRNRDATGSLAPLTATGSPVYSLVSAHLSVTYMLDVFGGNRRQTESVAAQAEVQRYQTRGVYLTLTTNVAENVIEEASLRGQIAATEKIIAGENDALAVMRQQSTLGQIAEADVIAEEATLAQTRATLPPLQQKLAQHRAALAVLLGRLPSDPPAATFDLAALHLPEELPVTLPGQLVDQRPDVRAAEANLHAATAQIGVATANMLPNITLSAYGGSIAGNAGSLFVPGTNLWNLASGVTQPIFEGGALLHKKHAAVALTEQAAEQYRHTVLAAFQDVGDALGALQSDANLLSEADAAERAATESLNIADHELDLGQISGLALLDAERTHQQAVLTSIQARAARYSDAVALFQALGGAW
jgi:NodT family efflux transporter outer membrane factor (OMF) lipoprotein